MGGVPARPAVAAAALVLLGSACAASLAPLTPGELVALRGGPPPPPGSEMPLPPFEVESLLAGGRFEILEAQPIPDADTRPEKLTVRVPDADAVLAFKWKKAPPRDAEGFNNAPRREVAAYELQKWFLEEEEYIVPPTAMTCIPLDAYRRSLDEDAAANLPESECVLGMLALWLQDVTVPDELLDRRRFGSDARYARHLGNLNLLTLLIGHRDSHRENFLVSRDDANRRVFSIDNGIAFDTWAFDYFTSHWDRIRVPAVPADAVERLRAVKPRQLEALGVVAQLRRDAEGVYQPEPPGSNLDPDRGVRRDGDVLQLGLTRDEIAGVARRMGALLEQVDAGTLPVF